MLAARLFVIVTMLLAACGGSQLGGAGADWSPGGPLVVGSARRVVTLDPATNSVVTDTPGIAALGGWSTVFTTDPSGKGTVLRTRDVSTGTISSSLRLTGDWSVRVAASDGSKAALMAPLDDRDPWIPEPRSVTTLLVADPFGQPKLQRFRLRGNYEPEAFSSDGRGLYLIEFVPPSDPAAYRVARLRLVDGRVFPVNTGAKGIVETMSGTRLEQVASADGSMLYTLYTTDPASYATEGGSHHHAAFIHVLDLEDGWAHCISLPREFWDVDEVRQAMALSSDGRSLFIVDADRSVVALMDGEDLEMGDAIPVDLRAVPDGRVHAVVTDDSHLVIGAGDRLVSLALDGLRRETSWASRATVTGLGADAHGLYVASAAGVEVMDAAGRPVAMLNAPPIGDVAYIGTPTD